jgi:beta-glucosidase
MSVPTVGGGGSALAHSEYQPRGLGEELKERLQDKTTVIENAWFAKIKTDCYKADTVVLSVGTTKNEESEGFDRTTLRLSFEQEQLILNAASVNPNVVVVVYAGSAIDMSAWADKVKAIVFAGYLGESATEAVANVLTGKCNPCGKLSETFPLCLEDTPTGDTRGNGHAERYTEGILVGYRWYETMKKEVSFPFGYGLSYAKFEYSDLKIEKKGETDYEVSFTVKNVSNVDGKEISQLYIRDPFSSVVRPEKELKGFVKTALKAGESKCVSLSLNARSFAFYSTALDKWYVENGEFEILVGASSRDIRLSETIEIDLPMHTQASRAFKY